MLAVAAVTVPYQQKRTACDGDGNTQTSIDRPPSLEREPKPADRSAENGSARYLCTLTRPKLSGAGVGLR